MITIAGTRYVRVYAVSVRPGDRIFGHGTVEAVKTLMNRVLLVTFATTPHTYFGEDDEVLISVGPA